MAYIKVDHSKFSAASGAIDTYITQIRNTMNSAEEEVKGLENHWQGTDYAQFHTQWEAVANKESTYNGMVKSLESYSKFLKYAAEKYKDAQTKAINRANSLPKW